MAISKSEEIEIVYEDADMLVLDKPAGMVTTNESQKRQRSVEDWLEENRPNLMPRKGIVHRLDKGTSGILIVAKNLESLENLKYQFKKRVVKKHYWTLAGGDVPGEGNIKMPIIRSNYTFLRFRVGEDGKAAETEFKLIKKIKIEGRIYSLLDINLKSGRTHQIRVHLSYLGWPIFGDKLYGGKIINEDLDRPFLHAYEMILNHPQNGKTMKFSSLLAKDLNLVLKKYDQD